MPAPEPEGGQEVGKRDRVGHGHHFPRWIVEELRQAHDQALGGGHPEAAGSVLVGHVPADAIVVLGGGVEPDGALMPHSLYRVMHGVRLYKAGLAPLIVFSGAAFGGRWAEADAAARLARDLGVPGERILAEPSPRTTREEAARISRRLQSRAIRRILLVTDSEHLARAALLFEHAGFEVLPAPADSVSSATDSPEERLKLLRRLSQELMARLYYRLAGYL